MTAPRAIDASTARTASDAVPGRSFAVQQPIGLDAQYQVEGLPLWLRCHIVDISTHGASLLLVDEVADPLRTVVIDVRAPGRADRILLRGEVHHSSFADGRHRISVAFFDTGIFDELALCELIAHHTARHDRDATAALRLS